MKEPQIMKLIFEKLELIGQAHYLQHDAPQLDNGRKIDYIIHDELTNFLQQKFKEGVY